MTKRDYSTEEGQKVLWDISTKVLRKLTDECKPLDLPAPEAFCVLMLAIGRFAGGIAYRSVDAKGMWKHLVANRTFFEWGFNGERKQEN